MTTPDPFPADALRDWLEALQSKSESPEVIALQRQLLDLLYRAARQLPEVQALVQAAQVVIENDESSLYKRADIHALIEALEPFRVASKND